MQVAMLLAVLALVDDAEIARQLREKGVKVTESKGVATSAEVADCSK